MVEIVFGFRLAVLIVDVFESHSFNGLDKKVILGVPVVG